ncbi:MAG: DinB family protein [Acidimicrobiales bacterium]
MEWTSMLVDQLSYHWEHQARPRLDGLSDDEYFWSPVPDAWSLRPRGAARTAMAAGGGSLVADFELPEPSPAPLTTIAWRLGHLIVGVFGARNAAHFGGPAYDYVTMEWPESADGALALLDEVYAGWVGGVRGLDEAGLAAAVGPAEGPFAERCFAELVLHINREAIHHLAEIALLRDLYLRRGELAP